LFEYCRFSRPEGVLLTLWISVHLKEASTHREVHRGGGVRMGGIFLPAYDDSLVFCDVTAVKWE
jgi:hypothetical protein